MSETTKSPVKDAAKLLKRIRDAFPELRWQTYRYLDEGWDHEVIILDDKVVFRFPNDEEYRAQLKDEIEVLRQLKPLVPVRIPEYAYVAPDFDFAGYPMITGDVLTKDVFDSLPDKERTAFARQLAGFLTALHTLGKNGHDFSRYLKPWMAQEHADLKIKAPKFLKDRLSTEDYARVQETLDDVDELLALELPAVFTHGDLYHSHFIWNQGDQKLGIIDFSDMRLGDPAVDMAEVFEYGADFAREVYGYYDGLKDETFLSRAWTYQRWIGVFMMVDHFIYHKMPFDESRVVFDRTKEQRHLT